MRVSLFPAVQKLLTVVYFDQRLGAAHEIVIFSVFCVKSGNKALDQRFGANLKNRGLCSQNSVFSLALTTKNKISLAGSLEENPLAVKLPENRLHMLGEESSGR